MNWEKNELWWPAGMLCDILFPWPSHTPAPLIVSFSQYTYLNTWTIQNIINHAIRAPPTTQLSSIHNGIFWLRHKGQSEWEKSHISIQGAWNECKHSGKVRNSSPSSKSHKQIAHMPPPSQAIPRFFIYLRAGMSSFIEFSMLLAACSCPNRNAGRWCGLVLSGRLHQPILMQWYTVTKIAADKTTIEIMNISGRKEYKVLFAMERLAIKGGSSFLKESVLS